MLNLHNSMGSLCRHTVLEAFAQWYGDNRGVTVARAPGRINIIGDHTDYNEGLVFPMILDRAIYVAVRPITGEQHHVRSENFDETVSFDVDTLPAFPHGHWSVYVGGILLYVSPGTAVEMLIAGDVPLGAGLSSSAALEMATGMALETVMGATLDPVTMAKIGQRVEHEYIGVKCGLMDQMVSRIGRSGHAFLLDCRSFEWVHVPVATAKACFIVVNSNVKRALASSKYNERRQQCARALEWFQRSAESYKSLRDVTASDVTQARYTMPEVLLARTRHVVEENERVLEAADALSRGEWNALGYLLTASHTSLRDLYDVSCKELDSLVEAALGINGVYGARMMGGGFGGCTINLVDRTAVEDFEVSIRRAYRKAHRRECSILKVGPGLEAASWC